MATRVFDGIKFCEQFLRGPPKEHSCQVWSKLAKRFRRRRCLKKLLTTHDGHITTLKAPLEHCAQVSQKAVNYKITGIIAHHGEDLGCCDAVIITKMID